MSTKKELTEEQKQKLKNISSKITDIYNGVECSEYRGSCLNSIRQGLEFLCLLTCDIYDIKITRRTKKGDIVENDNPTLGDMAPLIEKHFKQNDILWSKEVGMHIGSIWILGNLGSHAQKDELETGSGVSKATVENALNSMFIVVEWFFKLYEYEIPIKQKSGENISSKNLEFTEKANQLYEKLAILQQKSTEISQEQEPPKIDEDKFDDIYFDDLTEAIEMGQCVLFIGPDLSKDEDGELIHQKFYKSISRRNIEYNEKDGFFMPKAEKQIELKALNFYSKKFQAQNTKAQQLLKKLAQIPFSLIISTAPDDTVHKVLEKYNIKHDFYFYNSRTKHQTEEPTIENPIVFNMLGNTAKDGKYIFTHKQFYDYINQKQEVKIPFEIETKIKDVAHYLFLGIDFNKWYNRLLLFALNLYDDAEAYGFDDKNIEDIHNNFLNEQFNITFIEENYEEFVDVFLSKVQQSELTRNPIDIFIKNTTEDISSILEKSDENSETLEQLEKIENSIVEIENSIVNE